jgi:hypothetical protein
MTKKTVVVEEEEEEKEPTITAVDDVHLLWV